jgi:hypothetical protein
MHWVFTRISSKQDFDMDISHIIIMVEPDQKLQDHYKSSVSTFENTVDVTDDDKSFAMKGSAFLTDDGWHGCQKLTPGKKSKMGLLITIKTGGEIKTIDLLSDEVPEDAEIITRKVYENGSLLIDESFEEIRARAHA